MENDFTVRDVLELAFDVLEGLKECHANGVWHRDIKDENIFVSSSGGYKIGDFGVSKVLKESTKAESLKGTPNFLAPEVYLGKSGYTETVDLYSLGIVLYRLLNYGRNPFLPNFPEQYFSQDEDIAFEKRMSGAVPGYPMLGGEKIGNVILKALSNSENRYQSAEAFLSDLEVAIQDMSRDALMQSVKMQIKHQADISFNDDHKSYKETLGITLGESMSSSGENESNYASFGRGEDGGNAEGEHMALKKQETLSQKTVNTEGEFVSQRIYGETLGSTTENNTSFLDEEEERKSSSIHKHLFDSIGESHIVPPPQTSRTSNANNMTGGNTSLKEERHQQRSADVLNQSQRLVERAPVINEVEEPEAIDRNVVSKAVFIAPFVFLLVGLAAYFIVIPNIYGQVVSFADWLYSDPQNIIDTIRDPNIAFSKANYIILIRIFWYVWLAGFIASLFFVGKQLQKKPEPNATNAILVKREAYLLAQDITEAFKLEYQKNKNKDINGLLTSVKRIEEKLTIESDFGYGKRIVIDCENNIARQLQYLLDSAPYISTGNMEENIAELNKAITNINSLLRKRTELKKR